MAVSFLKKGTAAHKEIAKQDKIMEEKKKNNVYRFWLPEDKETQITFLDGNLNDDGLIDVTMYYEHQVHMNGNWRNWFVCIGEDEPCPICEGGDTASLVGAFTIIDHTPYTDKNGKDHKDEIKLFVAKRDTIKLLQKKATKHEGLAGVKFDVSRTGDKSPNVGSSFDFVDKTPVAQLIKKYKLQTKGPLNYGEVIIYRNAKELKELGFGSVGVGGEADTSSDNGASVDYDKEL